MFQLPRTFPLNCNRLQRSVECITGPPAAVPRRNVDVLVSKDFKNIYIYIVDIVPFPGDGPRRAPDRVQKEDELTHSTPDGGPRDPRHIAGHHSNTGDFTHAVVPASTLTLSVSVTQHYSVTPTSGTGTSRSGFQLQTATATSHLATSLLLSPGFTLAGLPGNSREPPQHSSNLSRALFFYFFSLKPEPSRLCLHSPPLAFCHTVDK